MTSHPTTPQTRRYTTVCNTCVKNCHAVATVSARYSQILSEFFILLQDGAAAQHRALEAINFSL